MAMGNRKEKKIMKRVLAVMLSLALAFTFGISVMPEKARAVDDDHSFSNSNNYIEVTPNFNWPIVYDGQEHDLTNVTVKFNGVELEKDKDYTVSYPTSGTGSWTADDNHIVGENGKPVGSATATQDFPIKVTGIGNYTGTWNSATSSSGSVYTYGVEVQYRIMPRVENTVVGEEVEGWTWQLDPDGLLTINGSGAMPKGFSHAYWVGGSDPDHYYKYGWRYNYKDMIKRAIITGNVTEIEENAFSDCKNLVEVTLPNTVEIIRAGAFYSCRCLRTVHAANSIYLPQSLKTLQNGAFGGNVYNLEIRLPDNVTTIEVNNTNEYSRVWCKKDTVTHDTLKAGSYLHMVEGWDGYYLDYQDNYNLGGTYTVYRYKGLGGDMVLPDFIDSVTVYDMFSTDANRVTSLTIPGNIRVLHGDAFRWLTNCTNIVIEPGNLTTLPANIFKGSSNATITIPDTVTTISGDPGGTNALLIVGRDSAILEWAKANGYTEDEDGTGTGKRFQIRAVTQPDPDPVEDDLPENCVRNEDGTLTYTEEGLGSVIVAEEVLKEGVVYRMYNPNSGEHFYTMVAEERDFLVSVGWNYESESCYTAPGADSDALPVYRLYNPNGNSHHFTMDKEEALFVKNAGWIYEGISFYAYKKDSGKGVPVYRAYNPNDGHHNFTTDRKEQDFIVGLGWSDEGIAWNVTK